MKNTNSKLITYFMAFILALGSLTIATSASAGETYDFNHKPADAGGYRGRCRILCRDIAIQRTWRQCR